MHDVLGFTVCRFPAARGLGYRHAGTTMRLRLSGPAEEVAARQHCG
jgi:hypothetical protein